ncbi:hypothetical protein MRX96_002572 [Rhipicephalus microplus]|uniref:uncharacterized protein LOC142814227 n=1 Tax=Rhipicephalus microplus TaxID=6941 RepID=UPI003F6C9A42
MLTRLCAFLLAIATTATGTLHCHLLKSGGGGGGRPFLGGGFPGGFKGNLGGGSYSGFRSDFQSGGFAPSGFAPGPGGFGVGPAVAGGFSSGFNPGVPAAIATGLGPGGPGGFGPALSGPPAFSRPPPVTFIPGGQTKVILVKVKHLGTTTHHSTGFNGGPGQGGPLLGPVPFGLPSSAGYGAPLKSGKGGWW